MLGDLLRRARKALGLSTEKFGDPEFSEAYVDALEAGAVQPSRLALEFFAERAQLSLDEVFNAATAQQLQAPLNVAAYEEDLHYQLNQAAALIHVSQVDEALQLISTAEAAVQPFYKQLSVRARYRVPYTRAMAYLQVTQPGSAQQELEKALQAIQEVPTATNMAQNAVVQSAPSTMYKGLEKLGDMEARVRNFLGVAYYMQKDLPLAEEQHLLCLRAVQAKQVTDRNLVFSIYRNLANDYWAGNKFRRAISIYNEALRVFDDLYDPLRLAGLHWGLSEAYKSAGDLSYAKLHMQKALAIYREKKMYISAAMLAMNLAEALMDVRQYSEAGELLKEAEGLLEQEQAKVVARSSSATMTGLGGEATDPLLLCNLYKGYAILARGQGHSEQGAAYAAQSIELGERVYSKVTEDSAAASAYPARHYSQALHIGGLIEEDLEHHEEADQLFQRALSVIENTGFEETHEATLSSYGKVLKDRGDFARAMHYLDKAAQIRIKANRTNGDC